MGCLLKTAVCVLGAVVAFLGVLTIVYSPKEPPGWDEFLHYHRPFPVNTVNAVGKFVQQFIYAPGLVTFDADSLEAAAIYRAGTSDFGSPTYREGLERLVADAVGDSRLHLVGAIVMREAIINYLHRRLQIVQHAKEHPEIQDLKIDRPIFIVGLPRTGTTLLHNMLGLNIAELRAPLQWELYAPFPVPQADYAANQQQVKEAEFITQGALSLIPNMVRLHPESTFDPSEDNHIQAFEFNARVFSSFMRAPNYLRWLYDPSVDLSHVMDWHETFLRHLMSNNGRHRDRRWLLKAPRYFLMIDKIFEKYPDAVVIHTFRHPEQVLPSMSSLDTLTSGVTSDDVDTRLCATLCREFYEEASRRTMAWRQQNEAEIASGKYKIIDIHLEDMKKNVSDVVRRIVEFAKLNVSEAEYTAMRNFQQQFGSKKHKPYHPIVDLYFDADEDGHFLPSNSPLMQYYNAFSPTLLKTGVAKPVDAESAATSVAEKQEL
eukprot:INCI14230.1.p1 GENE.INCI14230.1~~INCI14230.1.p1  ORF type:complete len:488 (-),score=90.76 INCI14230.1:653-2116(-)